MAAARTHKIHCNTCGGRKNHMFLKEYDVTYPVSDEQLFQYNVRHSLVSCAGCEMVSYFIETWRPDGEKVEEQYPKPDKRPFDAVLSLSTPGPVSRMHGEAHSAYSAGAPTLATAGLRALVEAICIEQGCKGRNLEEKINQLVEKGAVAKQHAEFLHLHRLLGNDAVHEMIAPSDLELHFAFEIVETMMKTIYDLPGMVAAVKSEMDKRRSQS
jgi:Domain of unknown function (DUF4145)